MFYADDFAKYDAYRKLHGEKSAAHDAAEPDLGDDELEARLAQKFAEFFDRSV